MVGVSQYVFVYHLNNVGRLILSTPVANWDAVVLTMSTPFRTVPTKANLHFTQEFGSFVSSVIITTYYMCG